VVSKSNTGGKTGVGRYYLDITQEVCPLTFVKTKLLLERMSRGEIAEVRLTAGEPLDNGPIARAETGRPGALRVQSGHLPGSSKP
jgi:TusA-related sulfurtransferase